MSVKALAAPCTPTIAVTGAREAAGHRASTADALQRRSKLGDLMTSCSSFFEMRSPGGHPFSHHLIKPQRAAVLVCCECLLWQVPEALRWRRIAQ
jgi:hypothetical protein